MNKFSAFDKLIALEAGIESPKGFAMHVSGKPMERPCVQFRGGEKVPADAPDFLLVLPDLPGDAQPPCPQSPDGALPPSQAAMSANCRATESGPVPPWEVRRDTAAS